MNIYHSAAAADTEAADGVPLDSGMTTTPELSTPTGRPPWTRDAGAAGDRAGSRRRATGVHRV